MAGYQRASVYRGLGRFVRPHRPALAGATLLVVVQTALELAAPWPLQLAVDHAIGGDDRARRAGAVFPYAGLVLAAGKALAS